MIPSTTIIKAANLIARNAVSLSTNGLYNGKAGFSLSLFAASGFLQDNELEDTAYKLFLESLITSKNDLSFENGLSGIGYVILYLIENKYVEANSMNFSGINIKQS